MRAESKQRAKSLLLGLSLACAVSTGGAQTNALEATVCEKPVYLTFDTGHMGVAEFVDQVLDRQKVRATFFLANEPTRTGGMSLDDVWAPWWKAMSQKGHVFGSHTFDHVYWLADLPDNHFRVRPSSGPLAGKTQTWSAQQYCEELARVETRFEQMTDSKLLPLFRAAGGKTSVDLIQAGASCEFAHVGWSPAGFLGDELPSAQYPNKVLLERALKNIRAGDILMAHLGIWSRQEPWAPEVLEPLIEGLKQKGLCFATLDHHPDYREWIKKYGRVARSTVPERDALKTDALEYVEMQDAVEDQSEQEPEVESAEQEDVVLLDISTEK